MHMITSLFVLLISLILSTVILFVILFIIGILGSIRYAMKKYDLTFSECIFKFIKGEL